MNSQVNVAIENYITSDEKYSKCLQLAKQRAGEDRLAEAIQLLELCQSYRHELPVLSALADLANLSGDQLKARQFFEQLAQANWQQYHLPLAKSLVQCEDRKAFEGHLAAINDWQSSPDYLTLNSALCNKEGDFEKGIEFADRAIEIDKSLALAWANKGNALKSMGLANAALECFLQAVNLGYKSLVLFNNIGIVLENLGCTAEALAYYAHAVSLPGPDKDKVSVAWNTAYAAMSLGMFEKAWEMYRLRKLVYGYGQKNFPDWQGENLQGKTLLLHREQGIADEIRFASTIADVAAEAKQIFWVVDKRLVPLYERSVPDNVRVLYPEQLNSAEFERNSRQIDIAGHVGDVACFRRLSLNDFPDLNGYLTAHAPAVQKWQQYFAKLPGKIKVGISWRTGMNGGARAYVHAPIMQWKNILNVVDVQFINIFYGEAIEELDLIRAELGVDIHTPININLKDDQDELAALLSALDLVVGPSTAPVELAMAIKDLPVWQLPFVSERQRYQWYFGERYSPWTPYAKPVFANSKQAALDVVARELEYVMSTPDPKQTLLGMNAIPKTCFIE